MTEEKRQFQIHLPGLLKILAESLYSTPKVAIRELLQNAHDSCLRRKAEDPPLTYQPRIDVFVDQNRQILTIQDNGSGLSSDEVIDYLSTIGRSYTRELGETLAVLSPDEAGKLIGQFGLGFLSAFLIASEVTLITQSVRGNNPTLEWHSTGDVHYELKTTDRQQAGTRVELHLKSNVLFLLNESILIEIVRQYADFLSIPIYIENSLYPVNAMIPPWAASDVGSATREYIQRAFQIPAPLAVIQLHDHVINLGHDTLLIPLEGFLFIPPTSVASVREYGDVNIFIKSMFICAGQSELLPSWARFVQGVVDSAYLQPTASREQIQHDMAFMQVQKAIESQLLDGLGRIAHNEPTIWKQLVNGHADVIMGWAVQDDKFFDHIAEVVILQTSRSAMSLADYRAKFSDSIYFITREIGSLQHQLLGESHGVPVIDASRFAVLPFLRKYALQWANVRLIQLDGELGQLLRPVPQEAFASLITYFKKQNIHTIIASFKPEVIPAIMIYPKDAEFLVEARNALDSGELPSGIGRLVSGYIDNLSASENDLSGKLYLNASCDLIPQLAAMTPGPARDAGLMLIYQIARLFSGRMLDSAKVTEVFQDTTQALKNLIFNS
jgi:molecular chaperone HtpG